MRTRKLPWRSRFFEVDPPDAVTGDKEEEDDTKSNTFPVAEVLSDLYRLQIGKIAGERHVKEDESLRFRDSNLSLAAVFR